MLRFTEFGSDKETKHSYGRFYTDIIKHRNVKTVFEVGVRQGGSIKAMLEADSIESVVGCDIDDLDDGVCNLPNFKFFHDGFQSVMPKLKGSFFDLLIDDGSHERLHQNEFLELALPLTAAGGVIVIEDIQDPDREISQFLNKCPHGWRSGVYDGRGFTGRYDDVIVYYIKPAEK